MLSIFFDYFLTKNTLKLFKTAKILSTRQGLSNGVQIILFGCKNNLAQICIRGTDKNQKNHFLCITIYTPFESPCRVDTISDGFKKF
jgi:hypothetical protein